MAKREGKGGTKKWKKEKQSRNAIIAKRKEWRRNESGRRGGDAVKG